ncbi:MAG: hypothetical protein HYU76_05795 [Betaproteobacteria bacterium]|nr:hypothetical protein [Betaproteobacteria bacterium]
MSRQRGAYGVRAEMPPYGAQELLDLDRSVTDVPIRGLCYAAGEAF